MAKLTLSQKIELIELSLPSRDRDEIPIGVRFNAIPIKNEPVVFADFIRNGYQTESVWKPVLIDETMGTYKIINAVRKAAYDALSELKMVKNEQGNQT